MVRLRQIDGSLRLSSLKELMFLRRAEDFVKWQEALQKAGLPE
jgi:hypothetical protein